MKTKLTAFIAAALLLGAATATPAKADSYNNDGLFGIIVGGTMGGLLGSTIGKGNGRLIATAAGAVIGGTLGHAVDTADDRTPVPARRVNTRRVVVIDDVEEEVIYHPVVRKVYVERPVKKVVIVQKKKRKHNRHSRHVAWKSKDRAVKVCNSAGRRCRWVM